MRWMLRPSRLVLVLAAIAIAAVPVLRREFVWNVRAFIAAIPRWPDSDYAGCILGKDPAPGIRPYDPEAELDAHPRDLKLRIAIVASHWSRDDPGVERAVREAIRMSPRNSALLCCRALQYFGSGELHFVRLHDTGSRRRDRQKWLKSARPDWREQVLALGQIAEPLKALDSWAAADPQNAAPHFLAAHLLQGARKDDEALVRAEAAARKQLFTLHEPDVADALVRAERLRGVPVPDAELASIVGSDTYRIFARIRSCARILNAVGWDCFDDGNKGMGFRQWLAAGRVGTLMLSHDRQSLSPRMVGIAVQGIGYSPIYAHSAQRRDDRPPRVGAIRPGEAYDEFVASRGAPAAERIYKELVACDSLRRDLRAVVPRVSFAQLPVVGYYSLARRLSLVAMPPLLLAGVLCLVAFLPGRRGQPTLSRFWSALVAGLAFAATVGILAASGVVDLFNLIRPSPEAESSGPSCPLAGAAEHFSIPLPDSPWFALAIAVGAPLLLMMLLAVAAVWVSRKKGLRYRAALGGAIWQTLPGLLAIFAIIWVGATAVAVREGGMYARYMARQREVGELRMLQEFAADRGIEIKRQRE